MANWHIDELLIEMIGAGWKRVKTLPGRYAGIAGIWQMIQPSTNKVAFIEFHVEHDELNDNANDILDSYGCGVRYNPNVAMHFHKKRVHWDRELKRFVSEMDGLEARAAAAECRAIELDAREDELVKTA